MAHCDHSLTELAVFGESNATEFEGIIRPPTS